MRLPIQILRSYQASPTKQGASGKIYLSLSLLVILLISFARQTQAQVCSLSITAIPSTCNPATNTYSTTAVVYLSNTVSGTVTVTDGIRNIIATIPSGITSASFTATFTNIPADGIIHTVTASQPGCTSAATTYPAPAACGVCSMTATTKPSICASATNTYSATTVVQLTNPTPGIVTVTNGAQSLTTTIPSGVNNYTFTAGFNGLISDGADHTVTITLPGCGSTISTYRAPVSCSVAGVCSVSAVATASTCNTATNTYSSTVVATVLNPTSGAILTITDGTVSQPFTTSAASQNTFIAVFSGFTSNGNTHTVIASLTNCGSFTTSYPAPTCSGTCSVSVSADHSICDASTNTYSSTVVATVLNPNGGTITISDGGLSQTFATTAVNQNTFTAVFTGLPSDGATHTVIASLPGCNSATTSYPAPTSCSITPACSINTPSVLFGDCDSATNTYSATAVVTVQNPSSGTLTISNGITSQPFAITAGSSNTFTMIFTGLASDGLSHTITASLPGCGSTTAAYTAPIACSATPVCSMTPAVTPGSCDSATNTYSATAVVALTNPPAGILTVTDGTRSLTTIIASGLGSFTFTATFNGLTSDGTTHTVTASLPRCTDVTTTYPAPTSCSATPVCSVSALATQGACASATNTFSNTVTVTLTNPTAGILTITDGTASLTFAVPATLGTVTAPAIFNGLSSNGSVRTVTVILPGCSSTTLSYTAPISCSSSVPVCSVGTPVVTVGSTSCPFNLYSVTAVVTVQNPTEGATLLVSNGTDSRSFTTSAGTSNTFTAVLGSSLAANSTNTVTASLLGCGTQQTIYPAPTPCIISPCSISTTITKGQCASTTNTYSTTVTVTLTNAYDGQDLIVTNGPQSQTQPTPADYSGGSYTFVFDNLLSDGLDHAVTATVFGCSSTTVVYTAPASCSSTTACPPFTLSPSSLPDGVVGTPYNVTIVASGGSGSYSFSVSSGSLPAGITLSPDGVLSGTPTATGSFGIRVLTTDNQGCVQDLDPGILTVTPAGSGPCPPAKCIPLLISRIR